MNKFSSTGDIEVKEVPMGSAGATCWVASVCLGDAPGSLLGEALYAAIPVANLPGSFAEEEGVEVFQAMGETEARARHNLNGLLLQAQVLAVGLLQDLQGLCPLTQGRP